MLRTLSFRYIYKAVKQIHRTSSAATPALPSEKHGTSEDAASSTTSSSDEISGTNLHTNSEEKCKSPMVAAVFASLKQPSKKPSEVLTKDSIDESILDCKTTEDLLTLTEKAVLNRKQALKIVTTLAEWSVNGLADMSTFETDPRFVSICQLLGRSSSGAQGTPAGSVSKQIYQEKQGDLSVVLNVTADDEAAKLASTLSLPQMIKVLGTLAIQKKRSLPLLRTLAFNIADCDYRLDIKKCADVLYAVSVLNFPDEVVLEKVSNDLIETVPTCEKSSVIGSICTSLGRLRYRNDRLLDCLSEWIVINKDHCRSQEFVSVLITLAIMSHTPAMGNKFFDILTNQLTVDDLPTASTWLDVVWSLVIFGKATSEHYRTVLSQRFVQRILSSHSESSSVAWKKKLLNINGAAKLCKDYKGPTLEENKDINVVPMVRTKEKQMLVNSVLDALSNLLPSATYLRNNIDSGMGFLIDGECRLDGKMTPFPLVDKKTGQPIVYKPGKAHKIAIMCWDYHDNTRGKVALTGANDLIIALLTKTGYRVLSVPHNEYDMKDKLSARVRYIEDNLKKTIKPNS